MVRIGVVNIDTSHPMVYAKYLRKTDRARYVVIYKRVIQGMMEKLLKKNILQKQPKYIFKLAYR